MSITRDSVKHPPPDGTVHPLAAYTLSFLKRLFGFEATIDTLFSDEENEVPLPRSILSHHLTPGRCRSPHACSHQGESRGGHDVIAAVSGSTLLASC